MTSRQSKLAVVVLVALLAFGAPTVDTTQSLLSDGEDVESNRFGAGNVPSDDAGKRDVNESDTNATETAGATATTTVAATTATTTTTAE